MEGIPKSFHICGQVKNLQLGKLTGIHLGTIYFQSQLYQKDGQLWLSKHNCVLVMYIREGKRRKTRKDSCGGWVSCWVWCKADALLERAKWVPGKPHLPLESLKPEKPRQGLWLRAPSINAGVTGCVFTSAPRTCQPCSESKGSNHSNSKASLNDSN